MSLMELIEITHSLREIMSLNFPGTLLLTYSSASFAESQDYKNEKKKKKVIYLSSLNTHHKRRALI